MTKPRKTQAECDYHARVAGMRCVLCEALDLPQSQPTTVHHIREGQGMAQRSSHWLVAPLCKDCHQGPAGIHGDQSLMRVAKLTELDMLALTIAQLSAEGVL